MPILKPTRLDAYQLFHQGVLAFADIERAGIRIDVPYLDGAIASTEKKIERLTNRLKETDVWKRWERKYKHKAKLDSKPQLGDMLFNELGYKSKNKTKGGERYSTDEEALADIDHPFIRTYTKRSKLQKAKGTYLLGIKEEVVEGFLHCFFNLHTVRTFRSSADRVNLQNQPNRDAKMAEIVRSCFIPRDGHQFLEVDYGALEVRGIACYCKDPYLIDYINDPTKDMHRDMASECYMIPSDQVEKSVRFIAKNQFVFPEFYGSYYLDCSRSLWDFMEKEQFKTKDGRLVKNILAENGITKLGRQDPNNRPVQGTFEYHIKEIEDKFRHQWFKVHTKWREDWWDKYKRKGYLDTLTGFRLSEVYRRNQVVNSPVQGSCFHCLLWSLIRMNNWLKRKKFQSRIVCQIHDSLLIDVWPPELEDVIAKIKYFATVAIRKHWPWLIVPLIIEGELCEVDASWFEKKGIEI